MRTRKGWFVPWPRRSWAACVLAVTIAATAGARADGASQKDVVERVRRLYAATNDAIHGGGAAALVFYTDADGYSERHWKRASTKRELALAEEGHFLATVYTIRGVPVKVVFRTDSPSGDWENTTDYYFWPDGKTAFRFESHVTSLALEPEDAPTRSGPYVVEKRRYHDTQGHMVRDLVRGFVKSSGKELPAKDVQQIDTESFPSVGALPFANQLR